MSRTRTLVALIAVLGLGLAALACSRGEAAPPPVTPVTPATAAPQAATLPATRPAHATARARLVFFMNPNGRPCQLQDQILVELGRSLSDQVEVVRYRTTEPGELAMFEAYGIRSLPQLLLADAEGRELRRATPGIQGPEQVRALIGR